MFERGGEGRKRGGRKWEGRRGRGGIGKREKRGVRWREQKEGEGDRGGGGGRAKGRMGGKGGGGMGEGRQWRNEEVPLPPFYTLFKYHGGSLFLLLFAIKIIYRVLPAKQHTPNRKF